MRNTFTVLLLLGVAAVAANAQRKYDTYSNARFAYAIAYPADLLSQLGEPDNADGQIFRSKNKSVELYVWGQYNALARTLEYEYLKDLKKGGVSYKLLTSKGYTISRASKGKIYYQKTILLGKDGDEAATFATFVLTYPTSQKAKFDAIVRKVAASFKFD